MSGMIKCAVRVFILPFWLMAVVSDMYPSIPAKDIQHEHVNTKQCQCYTWLNVQATGRVFLLFSHLACWRLKLLYPQATTTRTCKHKAMSVLHMIKCATGRVFLLFSHLACWLMAVVSVVYPSDAAKVRQTHYLHNSNTKQIITCFIVGNCSSTSIIIRRRSRWAIPWNIDSI